MKLLKSMEIEIGKYYALNPDKFYFSIDLRRTVKFINPVIVKAAHVGKVGTENIFFGKLVDVGLSIDYDTNNEIEFTDDDILREYTFKNVSVANVGFLFWMDL